MNVSIIITTRNRAASLRHTLESFRQVRLPEGVEADLLVVDNASTDETAAVVAAARLDNGVTLRYLCERTPGKSHALNRALAETRGEILLFSDDDVVQPANWIEGMCQPIVQHGVCGVAGGVRLAPELSRPWMTPLHRSWLAATEWLDDKAPRGMVGANMAFSREVLRRVPAFDTELGPGALGFGDEQLFASQLLESGYRIVSRKDVCVEHHFEPKRLLRDAWLETARKRGRSHAYRGYHWEHWNGRLVRPRLAVATCRLAVWRAIHGGNPAAEGCSEDELNREFECALFRGYLRECSRPRNYDYHGTTKRRVDRQKISPLQYRPAAANE